MHITGVLVLFSYGEKILPFYVMKSYAYFNRLTIYKTRIA